MRDILRVWSGAQWRLGWTGNRGCHCKCKRNPWNWGSSTAGTQAVKNQNHMTHFQFRKMTWEEAEIHWEILGGEIIKRSRVRENGKRGTWLETSINASNQEDSELIQWESVIWEEPMISGGMSAAIKAAGLWEEVRILVLTSCVWKFYVTSKSRCLCSVKIRFWDRGRILGSRKRFRTQAFKWYENRLK